MLEAESFPAGVAELNAALSDVERDDLFHYGRCFELELQ
jgi:hypothetical protein